MITLFGRIGVGVIDWRASLLNSKLHSLYRTTFVYSMVYVFPNMSICLSELIRYDAGIFAAPFISLTT